jgi:hypothetical protein
MFSTPTNNIFPLGKEFHTLFFYFMQESYFDVVITANQTKIKLHIQAPGKNFQMPWQPGALSTPAYNLFFLLLVHKIN